MYRQTHKYRPTHRYIHTYRHQHVHTHTDTHAHDKHAYTHTGNMFVKHYYNLFDTDVSKLESLYVRHMLCLYVCVYGDACVFCVNVCVCVCLRGHVFTRPGPQGHTHLVNHKHTNTLSVGPQGPTSLFSSSAYPLCLSHLSPSILTTYLPQQDISMLTFEGAELQGARAIIGKFTVRSYVCVCLSRRLSLSLSRSLSRSLSLSRSHSLSLSLSLCLLIRVWVSRLLLTRSTLLTFNLEELKVPFLSLSLGHFW